MRIAATLRWNSSAILGQEAGVQRLSGEERKTVNDGASPTGVRRMMRHQNRAATDIHEGKAQRLLDRADDAVSQMWAQTPIM